MNKLIYIIIPIFILFPYRVTFAQNATDSSDTIREKVQEKVNKTLNSPTAYIGSVTDLSENTLQISKYVASGTSDQAGEIQQVSTGDDTTFVNITNESKTVKFSDVAIGDFIVAMGYINGNSVLEAKRVLITKALEPIKRTSMMGRITSIEGKVVTIENEGGKTDLKFPKSWKGPEINELNENDQIIVAGTMDGGLEVRTLFVVPENASPTPVATNNPTPSE